ncbi:uncharacterized protein [Rutidosis leptorrhynchoides]|uniref:uncharacterized protein n=1 Tax=Rutidosis leptorrhynchoides TaxID=125765 RepID=UPI003A99551D
MLHKSFKPAKCKTSLKLATSRIKLMKNKKGVQINQMKRELAQLLESGQERTARIRVEHVIREEKMVAAYELIEIYCELIVARLPIIESQKTCPIDLKEAVTSVIFAAPRCSDISELSDIRKQFTAKYGKEFVSAALDLRPDCGVSRMLVEKLSAVAPNLQTKIKVLSAAAKDHNIEWDPTSFEEKESKPASDLLNGPPNFEKAAINTNSDPTKIQPPNTNAVHNHEEKKNAHIDFSEQNKKYTVGTHNVASSDDVGETSSAATQADMRSSGTTWNMEFKDANAAAQAAAESAERAAMAARAAAQFSNQEKIANQHPHVSNVRDNATHLSSNSGSKESSSDDRNPKIVSQQTGRSEIASSKKSTERFDGPSRSGNTTSQPTSFISSNDDDSVEDEELVNNVHMADVNYEESLHEDQKQGFSESKTELASDHKGSFEYENVNFFAEESRKKLPNIHSSRSHSSSSDDERDVGKRSVVGNPFAVVDHEKQFTEATNTSSNVDGDDDVMSDNDDVISDDDNGGPRFDMVSEYDEVEATHIWSPRRNTDNTVDQPSSQSHLFSESLSFGQHSVRTTEPLEADDNVPASFDDSDGPDSETESMNHEPSSVISNYNSGKSRIELNDLIEVEPSSSSPEAEEKKLQSQHELKQHNFDQETYDKDNNDSLKQPDESESTKELSFGTLAGGLRNKGGLRYPSYTKTSATELESSITGGQTFIQNSLDSKVSKTEDKNPSIYMESSDSDSEIRSKHSNTRSRFPPPDAFFDDDPTESEQVSKKVPSRARLGQGLSRRTRGSPAVPRVKSPEPKTEIPSFSGDRKPLQSSYVDEDPVEHLNYARRFKDDVKLIPESQQSIAGKNKSTISESRVKHSGKSKQEDVDAMPEPKIPAREPVPSRSTVETVEIKHAKTPSMGSERPSGENIVKKPSHVHPKLPDYESLAARLQSMRTDRQ